MVKSPQLTDEQIEQVLKRMSLQELRDKIEEMEIKQRAYAREHRDDILADIDKYCLDKYGVSMWSVITQSKKAPKEKDYPYPPGHPQYGQIYHYSGRGQLPKWLREQNNTVAKLVHTVK
jgi:DNA-binding protein H-NS